MINGPAKQIVESSSPILSRRISIKRIEWDPLSVKACDVRDTRAHLV